MAQNLDNYLADKALVHSLYLQRFSAGEKKKVLAVLVDMRKELVAKLRAGDVTEFSRGRLNKLLVDCNAIIKQGYNDIQTKLDLDGLAEVEAAATIKPLVAVGLEASLPTAAVMKSLVSNSLIEGAPSAEWWKKQSDDMAFKFAAQVRQGIAQGETMQQIVRRIAGSKKLGIPGIFEVSQKNSFALVHTSVMSVSTDSRIATYQANADVIKSLVWLATLDGKCCPACGIRDSKEYDLMTFAPIGHSIPWGAGPGKLHFNDRCTPTVKTKSFKELGIKLPELPDTGERASDLGPIDRKTTFDKFLKMHNKEYQDEMLGKGRAQLWRDGKLSLSQLLDGTGRELSLKELKKL
jgi:hypothetical protein